MILRITLLAFICAGMGACSSQKSAHPAPHARVSDSTSEPLVIGETFSVASHILGEVRRVNVMVPCVYGQKVTDPMPVLYMLDGGMDEDFLHVAGLV